MRSASFVVLFLLAAVPFHSKAKYAQFLSGGGQYMTTSVIGDKYNSRGITQTGIGGEYSLINKGFSNWRYKLRAATSLEGDVQTLGGGAAYHFQPFYSTTSAFADNVMITTIPKWSVYFAVEMIITRIQMSMVKTNGTGTDVVLGALFGPAIHLGLFRSLSKDTYLYVDAFSQYETSAELVATSFGAIVGMSYALF